MKYFITGTRRGLGRALEEKYGNTNSLEECDIFINCKYDGFSQVDMLYKGVAAGKRVINLGSHASDFVQHPSRKPWPYSVEKLALREANKQLFWNGANTTCINFGYIDTESVAHVVDTPKMSVEYCVGVIDWIIQQPYRVKEITISP